MPTAPRPDAASACGTLRRTPGRFSCAWPLAAKLVAERPDFALGQALAQYVGDHRFVAPPDVTWQPLLTDAAGDGKNPKLPDVIAVDRAESGDRLWYRVTFRDPLPRSFGVNLVANRSGDPAVGMK